MKWPDSLKCDTRVVFAEQMQLGKLLTIKLGNANAMTRKLGLSSDWISARFRDERSRLNMSQEQVAGICGVSRNAAAAWEKETSIPADALAKLFEHGFDPHYVITGLRYENRGVKEDYPHYFPLSDSLPAPLSPEEWKVLRRYRALSDGQKQQASAIMEVLSLGMSVGGSNVVISGGTRTAGRDFIQGEPTPKRKK